MTTGRDELQAWLARVSGPDWIWHLKYLSANDTYAKPNVHQGGPYLGKELLRQAFPVLSSRADRDVNPDLTLTVNVASHRLLQDIRVVWYNSRRVEDRANGRDEARMTKWGGKEHPLVREAATGSLVVLAFQRGGAGHDAVGCEIWITGSPDEEDEILSVTGPIDPGAGVVFEPHKGMLGQAVDSSGPCGFAAHELLDEWRTTFPTGDDVLEMALQRSTRSNRLAPDPRLLARRECEYSLYLAIENHVVLPRVREGFATVEEFVGFANAVTNRRKSRAGKSLELHTRVIFREENVSHSWGEATEGNRRPDFIFPSIERYRDSAWPVAQLRMLGAKTTCKDRWRQILNEAERIPVKHLLTLQEGVSTPQFQEMKDEGVRLVVPARLHASYPDSVQAELLSLEQFIGEARAIDS